jgi:hypothetical protein
MSTPIIVSGTTRYIPAIGERSWGATTTALLTDLANLGLFVGSGTERSLTKELNLGINYGIKVLSVTSQSANAGTTGVIRLSNGDIISWRNAGNTDEVEIKVDSSNRLVIDGVAVPTASSTDSFTNKTLTDTSNHISASILDSGTIPDARIQATGVTQHVGSLAHQSLSGAGTNNHSTIDSHLGSTSNPHSVTKAQVGLTNVDDTSDANKPVSTAQATAIGLKFNTADVDTDNTLTANLDTKVASQKAIKAYIAAQFGANDAMIYKGVIDCSSNPNYPAGDSGHSYKISVAGKIGGVSGVNVEVGDLAICTHDSSASGDQAAVGAYWTIVQTNLDGAVIGPASSTDNAIARFDLATGKLIQNSLATVDDNGAVNIPSGQTYKINGVAHVHSSVTEILTNKDIDGSTASDASRITLPKNTTANLSGLTRKEATIVYDTTTKKPYVDDGSNLKVIGGGLITEAKTTSFTAEAGKHYLVDMAGASANVEVTLPTGAAEAVVMCSVTNCTSTYRLILKAGSDIIVDSTGTLCTTVQLLQGGQTWVQANWRTDRWVLDGPSTFVSGTFAGDMTFTGKVIVPTKTPSAANDTGTTGQVAWDASYIYICIATNSWKRVAIAAW